MLVLKYREKNKPKNNKVSSSTKLENLKFHKQLYNDIQQVHLDSVTVKKVTFQNRYLEGESNFRKNVLANSNNLANNNIYHKILNPSPTIVIKPTERKVMRYSSVKDRFNSSSIKVHNLQNAIIVGINPNNTKKLSGTDLDKDSNHNNNNIDTINAFNSININSISDKDREHYLPIIIEKPRNNGNNIVIEKVVVQRNNINNIEKVGDRYLFKTINNKELREQPGINQQTKDKYDKYDRAYRSFNNKEDSIQPNENFIKIGERLIKTSNGDLENDSKVKDTLDINVVESKEFKDIIMPNDNPLCSTINLTKKDNFIRVRQQQSLSPTGLRKEYNRKFDKQDKFEKSEKPDRYDKSDKFKSVLIPKQIPDEKDKYINKNEDESKKKIMFSPGVRKSITEKNDKEINLNNRRSPPPNHNNQNLRSVIKHEEFKQRIRNNSKLKELIRTNKTFQYVIKPGNNPDLIRMCFNHRSNWKELNTHYATNYNYKWKQSKKDIEYCLLTKTAPIKRVVNHFEFEHEISNKGLMFTNMLEYCDRNKLNAFDYLPFTIVMKYNQKDYKDNYTNFSELFKKISSYTDNSKTPIYTKYSSFFNDENTPYKCVNTNIKINNSYYDEKQDKNYWLLKPTDLHGGRGINIVNTVEEVEKLLKKYFEGVEVNEDVEDSDDEDVGGMEGNMSPKNGGSVSPDKKKEEDKEKKTSQKYRSNNILLQKYIEKPLTYYGRKFDIRMWILITHNMEVYIFKEGHLKTTSTEYNINSNDKFIHITNYSLQKKNDNFQKYEEGNEVSFPQFQEFLDKEYPDKNFQRDIYPQIIDIVKVSTMSIADKLNRKERQFCYVVLGYDFMIDANFKVWLIEVNKNTGLVFSSPVIRMLLPRMIDDSLKLTIDTVFGVPPDSNTASTFPVEGYTDEENMWEYVQGLYD